MIHRLSSWLRYTPYVLWEKKHFSPLKDWIGCSCLQNWHEVQKRGASERWKLEKDLLLFMKPTSWFLNTKKLCLLSAHWNATGRIPPQGYWLGGDHYNWFNWFCILVDLGYFLSVLLWKYSLRETLHCQRLFGGEERTDAPAHIHTSWAALTGWQFP